jgi:hypothetical protein
MKKTILSPLVVTVVCVSTLGASAYAGLLDDFSTSDESNYQFLPAWQNPSDGWNVSGGVLSPYIPGNATGAWLWKGAELSTVGDSVSLDFQIINANASFGTAAGLYFANTLASPTAAVEISLLAQSGSSSSTLQFNGTDTPGLSVSGPQTGLSTLTVTMTGETADSSTYSVDLSGGGLGDYNGTFTFGAGSAYFGPSLYDSDNPGDVVYDNLTANIQSVPEPATLALTGFGSLSLLLFRRRNQTAAKHQ